MDLRAAPKDVQMREVIDRAISRINTAIPGKILSFNASSQIAEVAPALKLKQYIDGKLVFIELPPIVNVPLIYPYSVNGGFAMTIPVSSGDPCLLIFSQRAIDNWHDRGGIQPTENTIGSRHHDLTDAFALLAPVPLPNVLSNWESSGIELRNTSKSSRITVKDDSIEIVCGSSTLILNSDGSINMVAPGDFSITGNVSIVGTLLTSLGITSSGGSITSTVGNISDANGSLNEIRSVYNSHTHDENGDGGGVTDPPNQGMS